MGKIMTTVSADPELLEIVTQLRRLADRTDRWFDQKENHENFVEGDYKVAEEIPELFYSLEDSLLSLLAYKISYDLNDLF